MGDLTPSVTPSVPCCDNNPNQEQLVECANQHIRAKRKFEEAYAAGKL